jgi:hypothetical protein
MPEHPAELPAEGEGGGFSGWTRPHGGIGGPAELPPPDWVRFSAVQLVSEVLRLRNQVHALESAMLVARLTGGVARRFGGGLGGPQELPEGEGGGGGGTIPFPHEIHEIAELPVSRLVAELSSLASRFVSFERFAVQQFETITKRLDAMQR